MCINICFLGRVREAELYFSTTSTLCFLLHLGPVLLVKPIQVLCHHMHSAVWACLLRAGALYFNLYYVYLLLKLFLLKLERPGRCLQLEYGQAHWKFAEQS